MEYMDESIYKFIQRCNSQLSLNKRKGMISQICHGLKYMHHKGILHRDISLSNVFVKHYEDVDVFKIGDFGLVKMPESTLTSTYSETKGCAIVLMAFQKPGSAFLLLFHVAN